MNGKVIDKNNEIGHIEGEDQNIYFFNVKDLEEECKIDDKVLFRPNKEQIKENYAIYKATNIIKA